MPDLKSELNAESWHRVVFEAMGTVISVLGKSESRWAAAADEAKAVFQTYDDCFSLYKPGSEINRINQNEISIAQSSPIFRNAFEEAYRWREITRGAFTPHRPDGTLDLNGVVKALAIAETSKRLKDLGLLNFCINAGGDVLYSGVDHNSNAWVTSITDPCNKGQSIANFQLFGSKKAVATSGNAERGNHIWSRFGEKQTLTQVTVVAEDIITADVLATAIIAAPISQIDELLDLFTLDTLMIDTTGELLITENLRSNLL